MVIAVGKTQAKKTRRARVKEQNRRRKRAKEQNPPFVLCVKTGKVRHKNADYAVKALARMTGVAILGVTGSADTTGARTVADTT